MYQYKVSLQALKVSEKEYNVGSSSKAQEFLADFLRLREEAQEVAGLLVLDNMLNVISYQELARGSLFAVSIDFAVLFRTLYLSGGNRFMIYHNHPTGTAEPSKDDIALTQRLKDACGVLGFGFLDHFIIAQSGVYSFAEHNNVL